MEQITLKLIVRTKQYEIPFKFKKILDIKNDIYLQLLVDPNHKYNVNSSVSEDNFMLFIDYLVHEKEPKITISNYFDFYQLDQEFELTKLNEIIQFTKNSWNKCELNLYLLNDPKIKDKRMIEQTVSQNLDEYVNNYGSQLMTVNFRSLLNIFNDPNKKFTEHNKAYTLIKQCYEDTMNESIFILLSKIDGNKLNESNFEDNILNQSSRFGYMAQINLNYYKISREFQKLIEINQKQEEVNKKLNSELNEVNKKLSLINNEFESYKNQKEEVFKSQKRINEEQLNNNQKVCDEINVIRSQLKRTSDELESHKNQNEEAFKSQERKNEEQFKNNQKACVEINVIQSQLKRTSDELKSHKKQKERILQKQNEKKILQPESKHNDVIQTNQNLTEIQEKNNKNNSEIHKEIKRNELELNSIKQYFEMHESKIFDHTEGYELHGIIKCLSDKTSGNIHDNGTICITSSSNQPSLFRYQVNPRFLCDFNELSSRSMWSPNGEQNATLLYDFKKRKIKLSDYTFHTPKNRTEDYPRSWIIECSNDNNSWVTVDTRNDERVMNNKDVCHTFKCQNQKNEYFQYIKITSTGPCWSSASRYYFDLSAIEFYGFLDED